MPQLTVVVPLMDQVDAFENTLASILRYDDQRIQVVVTHDGRYEDPHGILDEVDCVVIPSHRNTSRLGRVAAAVDSCRSPWIHWLAPGIEATEGWCDDLLEFLGRHSELGLLSPRVFSAAEGTCVASCILTRPSGHALYLEDVWGEEWSAEEVVVDRSLVGPTGWAGFCRRQLLEQWQQEWSGFRLPNGYAEAALGLMVRADGWDHQISESVLMANEATCEKMEQGVERDGRAAAAILGRFQSGTAAGKCLRSLGYAFQEMLMGVVYPGNLGVALARLGSLSLATGGGSKRPVPIDDAVFSMSAPQPSSEQEKRRAA